MDSWLSASDSDIEDIETERDLVTFENIQKYYSPYCEIVASYTLGESLTNNNRDWIGLFKSGWEDLNNFEDFQWASMTPFSQLLPRRRRVVFDARGFKAENKMNTFQFLYISPGNNIVGVSNLFHILDLPQESHLNFELLENALLDDEEDFVVPEPFSGFTEELSNPSYLLPEVANINLDSDIHNSVVALYSTTESFNKRLMRTEMPFMDVQNEQLQDFFNLKDLNKKSNQRSWLQKIFDNTQPSVEMFSDEVKPTSKNAASTQSQSAQQPYLRFEDSTTLNQSSYDTNSWIVDFDIIESTDQTSVVDDYYEHPFGQFASLLDEQETEPLITSSVVEEFKSKISGNCEHLESIFCNDDWLDLPLPDCEPSGNFKQTCDHINFQQEFSSSANYDFSEDMNLDILFHEKAKGKKNKQNSNLKRQKRKYKKLRKNKKMITHTSSSSLSQSSYTSSKASASSLPIHSSKPSKIPKMFRKRKPKTQVSANLPVAKMPKESTEFKCKALVPYNPLKLFTMIEPILSSPVFRPLAIERPHLAVVPYVPVMPKKAFKKPKSSTAGKKQSKVKGYFTKKHQRLSRNPHLASSSCYNCKANRKISNSYKDKFNFAQKQIELFYTERADLQNQINKIMEELTELKTEKNKGTKSVDTTMEDQMIFSPEMEIILSSLEDNNELLDMAFQSALVDNAQLRTDMTAIQESLQSLNKQFIETESEFKSAILAIEKKQQQAESKADSSSKKWEMNSTTKIERLQSIVGRREQMVETLQDRVNSQSLEIIKNNETIIALKQNLEVEKRRADQAEADKLQLETKMESMVAKQTTSTAKPKWGPVVTHQSEMNRQHAQFTMYDETTNTSRSSATPREHLTYKWFKSHNDELKRLISEGKCRTCGMTFSPSVDKRIIEEHIAYHKQFKQ